MCPRSARHILSRLKLYVSIEVNLKAPSPDEAFYFQISILSLFSQQDISRCHFKWCNRYAEYLFRFLFAIDFAIAGSALDIPLYLLQFWEDYGFISAGIYPSAPFIEPIFLCFADPIPPCHRFWSAYPSYVHGSPPGCGSSGNELVRFVTFYLHSGTLYQFQECVTSRRVIVRFCSCLARTTFSKF